MTRTLAVVSDPNDWTSLPPGVELVSADLYLAEPSSFDSPRLRVVNLCRSTRYQSLGYYVSLLAEARDHRPLPSVATLQEIKSPAIVKVVSAEIDELIQRSLGSLASDEFELSVYFGRNVATTHDALAAAIFQAFPGPMVRAYFRRKAGSTWRMTSVEALGLRDVSAEHRDSLADAFRDFTKGTQARPKRRKSARYDLGILRDPGAEDPASCDAAIAKFEAAAAAVGFAVHRIGKTEYARTLTLDALFIRDTTRIQDYTYRFAMKAKAEGLVVMDEPDAIVKCLNKVYLAELLAQHGIPAPRSMTVTARNAHLVEETLGLPCVLKRPDGAFSIGVTKAETPQQLEEQLGLLLKDSSLVIAQAFTPTDFDWRIGILERQPLYVCKYHMAGQHWQILNHDGGGDAPEFGNVEGVKIEDTPADVLDIAVRAASLYGNGLFGVDIKVLDSGPVVIEVNDNPTIDAGDEDSVLGDDLYLKIMRYLMVQVERKKRAGSYA